MHKPPPDPKTAKNLRSHVDASGFAFQVAVQEAVERLRASLGWSVVSREVPWLETAGQTEGFVDLVLEREAVTLVVECKRSRGQWIFLRPVREGMETRKLSARLASRLGEEKNAARWVELDWRPESVESEFCVVKGDGERSMLEKWCAPLITATDQVGALRERWLHHLGERKWTSLTLPLIVTTADMYSVNFRPENVSLGTGELPAEADFRPENVVRFRKAFWAGDHVPPYPDLGEWKAGLETTVLVVRATALEQFLRDLVQRQ